MEHDKEFKLIHLEVQNTNLILENEIRPNIRMLAENYVPAAVRYEEATADIG